MRIDIVTLFPEMFTGPLDESIPGRAQRNGVVRINLVDLREFTHDRHRSVDDRPYGGGAGMVLKPEPLFEAVEKLQTPQTRVVLLTPQGHTFSQQICCRLAEKTHLIFICGHYEGVDQRVRDALVDEEISIGDYVLSNGNLAAMVVTDAIVRLLPGALGCEESTAEESFGSDLLLEYPQYTRPAEFRDMKVPDVLLSGDHARIQAWRAEQREIRTRTRRPDLLQDREQGDQKA